MSSKTKKIFFGLSTYKHKASFNITIFFVFFIGSIFFFLKEFKFFSNPTYLFRTPKVLMNELGGGDKRWYFEAALNLHNFGYLIPDNYWIINLWPPGMMWTNYLMLDIFPSKRLYTLALIIFTSLALSLLLTVSVKFVIKETNTPTGIFFLVLLLISSTMRDWIISTEIFYADTLGAIFMLLFFIVTLIFILNPRQNLVLPIYGGITLAIAAYYRSPYYIVHYSLYIVMVILFVAVFVNFFKLHSNKKIYEQLAYSIIVLVVFKILTLPWIYFLENQIRPGNSSWTVTQDTGFVYAWVVRDDQPDFLKYGGIGWACELEKERCEEVNAIEAATPVPYSGILGIQTSEFKKMTLAAAINNPISYMKDRLRYFSIAWFSRDGLAMNNKINPLLPALQFVLFIILGIYLIYLTVCLRKFNALILIFSIILLIAPYAVYHLEVRYFMSLKLIACLAVIPFYRIYGRFPLKTSQITNTS